MGNQEKARALEEKFKKPLNNILKWVWVVAKHPFSGVLIGITIAILIFILSRMAKEPVYVVSPWELVAQTVNGEEKLKIIWNNEEIKNVASVKIGIWNDGSRFIDKNDVSSTNPIRIKPMEKVDILAVQVLKTSRPTLKFDRKIETDANGIESVVIKIKEDEALEKLDGALFHILFSGPQECTWKVIGRIKGVPKGFQPRDWTKVLPPRKPSLPKHLINLSNVVLFIIALILVIVLVTKRARRGFPIRHLLLSYGGLLAFLLFLLVSIIIREYSYLSAPSWLSW